MDDLPRPKTAREHRGWASRLGLWDSRAGAKSGEAGGHPRELKADVPPAAPRSVHGSTSTAGETRTRPESAASGERTNVCPRNGTYVTVKS